MGIFHKSKRIVPSRVEPTSLSITPLYYPGVTFAPDNDDEVPLIMEIDHQEIKSEVLNRLLHSNAWIRQREHMIDSWLAGDSRFNVWERWQLALMANCGLSYEIARALAPGMPVMDLMAPPGMFDSMAVVWGERILLLPEPWKTSLEDITYELLRKNGDENIKQWYGTFFE